MPTTPTYTDKTLSNLVISKISQAKFDELKNAGLLNEDELYIVENETLDALSNVIKNVANPVLSTDAANKAYVDGKQVPIATALVPGIVKPDNNTITIDANGVLSANTPGIATINTAGIVKPDGTTITVDSSGTIKTNHSYVFNTPAQTTSTTDETDDTISVELANRAINIVPLATTVKYLNITFPQITAGYARDFFVRLVITGDVPTISFSEYGGGLPDFDIADDAWSDMEQGANIIMFTETSQP